MAKNKKIKISEEEVLVTENSTLVDTVENEAEEVVVASANEEEVVEQPVNEEEVVVEAKQEEQPKKKEAVEKPQETSTVEESNKIKRPLVCESRHTRMQYVFTQPGLARHLMINNNY